MDYGLDLDCDFNPSGPTGRRNFHHRDFILRNLLFEVIFMSKSIVIGITRKLIARESRKLSVIRVSSVSLVVIRSIFLFIGQPGTKFLGRKFHQAKEM